MASSPIPLPPDVASQMPNMGQYAAQSDAMFNGGQQAPPQGAMGADPASFANDALNQIAQMLGKVAEVLMQTRPELQPYLQAMAEAGAQLQGALTAQDQGDTGNQTPPQAEGPSDVPMA